MEQAIGLFRTMMRKGKGRQPAEALVHFYWDKQEQRYFIRVPKQIVSGVSVDALLDDEELMTSDRYIHYADLHSHNRMPAVFSKTDDHDERATRVYMVVGRLDRYFPEITVRISNGGRFLEIAPAQVLEMPPVGHFPVLSRMPDNWKNCLGPKYFATMCMGLSQTRADGSPTRNWSF